VKTRTKIAAAVIALAVGWALSGSACSETTSSASSSSKAEVDAKADARVPYLPKNDVEFNNYNRAQELYDDPSSIIWCTGTFASASSPIFTVPIAGKLTSSSVSYYPGSSPKEINTSGSGQNPALNVENRSIDGMYHGNPPAYRYGFTPGGQYAEFSGIGTFCTTALTKFQRESTQVTVNLDDGGASDIQKQAEAALKAGDPAKAEQLLEQVAK